MNIVNYNVALKPSNTNIQAVNSKRSLLKQNSDTVSFGNAGLMSKVSKGATSLIIGINKSRLPGPIKSWATYMIANVPVLSNIVFKSPITEGDLIFATAAALPFARTVSETKNRRREAFLRDMSGFVIFLACVRAVQGLEWEKPLRFLKQAKPLQALAKDNSIGLMGMLTRMFPDTQRLLSEVVRVDKIDDIVKAAMKSGNADDVISAAFKSVKEPGVKDSALEFFKRVPRAKEHFVKAIQSAASEGKGIKSTFTNLNKLKNFRSVAGAIVGGIAYILISGIGINKLNQYLAKRDAAKKKKAKDLAPKGIPFSAKMNESVKIPPQKQIAPSKTLNVASIAGGHLSNRQQVMNEFDKWIQLAGN